MRKAETVPCFPFFCAVFVCRLIALFTFIITDSESFPAGDRSVVFLPFLLTGMLAAVPVLLVIGRKEDRTLFTLTNSVSPLFSKTAAVLYAAGAIWSEGISLTRFDLFMSTVMFSGARLWGLILLLTVCAVAVAGRGVRTTVRMSVLVLALAGLSMLYAGVTAGREFDVANLDPPLRNGVLPLFRNSFSAVARTGELAALLVYAPQVRGGVKKGVFFWFLSFGLTVSLLYTLIMGVTGAYGERQMFQLYALTVLSKIGAVERLDALICAVWVLCSLTRLSFYLLTAGRFLHAGFGLRENAGLYAPLCAAVFAVYLPLSGSVTAFSAVLRSGVNEIVFALLVPALPLTALAAAGIKNRKATNKTLMKGALE